MTGFTVVIIPLVLELHDMYATAITMAATANMRIFFVLAFISLNSTSYLRKKTHRSLTRLCGRFDTSEDAWCLDAIPSTKFHHLRFRHDGPHAHSHVFGVETAPICLIGIGDIASDGVRVQLFRHGRWRS